MCDGCDVSPLAFDTSRCRLNSADVALGPSRKSIIPGYRRACWTGVTAFAVGFEAMEVIGMLAEEMHSGHLETAVARRTFRRLEYLHSVMATRTVNHYRDGTH